jgi:hypothetical protein
MLRAGAVIFALALAGLAGYAPTHVHSAETKFISIGTGGVTGVYYPAGGAICRLVNTGRARHGIRCAVESTGGSVANIDGIRAGTLDFGLVQSDWQYYAYNGHTAFRNKGAFAELRALFSLHVEPFTVVARTGSGIRNFHDLKGRRVSIGNPGSGQRRTMDVVLDAIGWTLGDFETALELSVDEQSQALCQNRVDAMVFVVGHPSGSIKEATTSCASMIVDAGDVEALVRGSRFYRKATIPGGMYAGVGEDVSTFGVIATLVSSDRVADETVYQVVKAVFANFAEFKRQHPSFKDLDAKEMIKAGLTAPIHSGAARYYKQVGWQ